MPGAINVDGIERVIAPVLADADISFAVPVMLETVPVTVAKVPLVGNVTFVLEVILKIAGNAPDKVNAPAVVSVPPSVMSAPVFRLLAIAIIISLLYLSCQDIYLLWHYEHLSMI